MLSSIEDFLRYFSSINKRTMRDVAALPPQADGWKPPAGEGENSWSVNEIVAHVAASRGFFASAYRAEGWIFPEFPDVSSREQWVPVLERSEEAFREALQDTPADWLQRRVPLVDMDSTVRGWRVLMMMTEHDIHHRSQIDTYAGLNSWDPPQIYGRRYEQIEQIQDAQRAQYRGAAQG